MQNLIKVKKQTEQCRHHYNKWVNGSEPTHYIPALNYICTAVGKSGYCINVAVNLH